MRKIVALLIGGFSMLSAFAQPADRLIDMTANPVVAERPSQRSSHNEDVFFMLDTMHLPFIDDFSTDKRKKYNIDLTGPGVTQEIDLEFLVGSIYFPQLDVMFDTSFSYFFDNINQAWDSTPNPPQIVDFYAGYLSEGVTSTDTFWIAPESRYDPIGDSLVFGDVDPDTILYNFIDTLYFVEDDGYSIWTDNMVYWNETYSNVVPTIGMMTFDGLDSLGFPYDQQANNPNTWEIADYFTSKPIYLKTKPAGGGVYQNNDSITLSFYYQGKGLGSTPAPEDSLVLQFYSPVSGNWNRVWSTDGKEMSRFKEVRIKIQDTIYFQDGFRFRFYNRANITGNFDHWHIDYVRLDDGRTLADSTIDDVAWQWAGPSLLKEYRVMPWSHFKAAPNQYMNDTLSNRSRNHSSIAKNMGYWMQVMEDGNQIYFGSDYLNPVFSPKTNEVVTLDASPFTFPTTNNDARHTFRVNHILNTTPDANRSNDTATTIQDFMTYYAYHDRSAEKAYFVDSSDGLFATHFNIKVKDTLKAVNIHFPRTNENILSRPMRIMVWKSLSPEVVLYEGPLVYPRYTARDVTANYPLEEVLEVEGDFYVGYMQFNDPIIIGIDLNNNAQPHSYYKTVNGWFQMSYEGAPFVQADFGEFYPHVLSAESIEHDLGSLRVYPNPTSGYFRVEGVGQNASYRLLNASGSVIEQAVCSEQFDVDMGHLPKGLFILQVTSSAGTVQTEKIIYQ